MLLRREVLDDLVDLAAQRFAAHVRLDRGVVVPGRRFMRRCGMLLRRESWMTSSTSPPSASPLTSVLTVGSWSHGAAPSSSYSPSE